MFSFIGTITLVSSYHETSLLSPDFAVPVRICAHLMLHLQKKREISLPPYLSGHSETVFIDCTKNLTGILLRFAFAVLIHTALIRFPCKAGLIILKQLFK